MTNSVGTQSLLVSPMLVPARLYAAPAAAPLQRGQDEVTLSDQARKETGGDWTPVIDDPDEPSFPSPEDPNHPSPIDDGEHYPIDDGDDGDGGEFPIDDGLPGELYRNGPDPMIDPKPNYNPANPSGTNYLQGSRMQK